MEEIKIIEGIVIMMFIFPALAIMVVIFLAVFTHISFHRTGLAFSFYAIKRKFFILNMIQLLCFPLSLIWILLCLVTIVLTFFLV